MKILKKYTAYLQYSKIYPYYINSEIFWGTYDLWYTKQREIRFIKTNNLILRDVFEDDAILS